MAAPPRVRAFLLCDAAVRDAITRKTTLVGTFDRLAAPAFPATFEDISAYARLTGLNGDYVFRIEVLAADLRTVIASVDFETVYTSSNPLESVELVGRFARVQCPATGRYTVRLLYNGQVAEDASIDVVDERRA